MHRTTFGIFLLLIGVFFPITTTANNGENYSFIRVDATNGLVNNHITCIYKDSRDFIWIGTSSGLSRYDGVRFVNYKHNEKDTLTIRDNFIESIQEDNNGNLWVKTRWELMLFNFEKEVFVNNVTDSLAKRGIAKPIEKVFIDKANRLFFMSQANRRFYNYDSIKNESYDPFQQSKFKSDRIIDIYHDGKTYTCLYEGGVVESFNGEDFQSVFVDETLKGTFEQNDLSGRIFVDKEGDLWVYGGNTKGVFHLNKAKRSWEHYTTNSIKLKLTSNIVRKIVQDDKGQIWLGTDHGGIDIINKFSNQVQTIYNQKQNEKSLSQNSITDIFIDNNNIIWVGTYKKGLCYYHESIHKFPSYHWLGNDGKSLPFNDVNCFAEDKNKNLWIGTNGGGLIYFDRRNNKFQTYKHNPNDINSVSSDVIVSLFVDDDGLLWIGTYAGGLNSYDGQKFTRYLASKQSGLRNDNIWTINQDNKKRIWLGTLGSGIVLFDKQMKNFLPVPNSGQTQLPSLFVADIFKLRDGNLFIGTAEGVIFYDINENRYRSHPYKNTNEPLKVSNYNVNEVYEDSRGLLWVASREGLSMMDPNSGYSKIFRTEDGLSSDIVNCILEDEYQSIWISKSNGLSQIAVNHVKPNKYEFSIHHYTEADGLQGQEFNVNADFKTTEGELIFGGPNGFNLFQAKNIKYNKNLSTVVFTGFSIFNNDIKVDQLFKGRRILNKSIVLTKKLTLTHSMNVFSIEFAALDFFVPEKVKYKYMLEGFDKEWVTSVSANPKVVYTNLNPGTYIFKVKACNNDNLWNANYSQLRITVLPPFYASPLAYLVYLILLVGLIIYLRYSMLKKTRLKFAMEQERVLAKRNHELDEMKLKFLTNVSHEFRTPLTLILAPIEKLRKKEDNEAKMKLLETVERNANNLLNLVNQLLDFRKLDLHGLKYNPSYGDIVAFLQDVCDNFKESFDKKGVELVFKSKLNEFYFRFDKDKLHKVMLNLISNALKFTSTGGSVKVLVENETLGESESISIKIKDTGIGVERDEKDKIFERFYQSKNNISLGVSGSGIGLNLAKEMVVLHGGTIQVESEPGKGAEFIVSLPKIYEKDMPLTAEISRKKTEKVFQKEKPAKSKNDEKSTVLLIEDNFDFRNFMKESLDENFVVHEAQDGVEGFEIIHKIIPDLIISDVMMPRMDGLDLCRRLKEDIRTSHIPLILLTARTADEDKIKGFEIGADDYITKPFNMDLLLLRVQNVMEKRREIQHQFQKNVSIETTEVEVPSMEEKLIKKAVAFVEKNIDEPKFSVEDLSAELGMSRVYLYKKLLAITGKTPVEFIRIIRLKRGAQLLEKSKMNIAEVAYAVGFNSPRYFSKYFKEEYGVLPKAYIKMYGNRTDDRIDIS